MSGAGFESEWSWQLEPVSGGTRVIHAASFEPFDRWTGILVRLGRSSSLGSRVETHLRVLKERAEAAREPTSDRRPRPRWPRPPDGALAWSLQAR